jgi:DNA replication and repair protein RecF
LSADVILARPALRLDRLVVRNLRNLQRVSIDPAERLNVVTGDNGHGKTSLLEGIYLAATSKSFRTSRTADAVSRGAESASLRARFRESSALASVSHEQSIVLERGRVAARIDDNKPASLAAFATRAPVIVFHPDEMALSTGPASGRRQLLDRLALYLDPESAEHRSRYSQALKARQQLLLARSTGSIDAFEALAARHGAAVSKARRRAADALLPELLRAFSAIGEPGRELGAWLLHGGTEDEDEARHALRAHRDRDAHRPTAGFGPHRDDLALLLDGHPVRSSASQGQHRAITLALKTAEAECIATARGVEPLLLLDDVSSELDEKRTDALFAFLARTNSQIFITTTRSELVMSERIPREARLALTLRDGAIAANDSAS